MLKIIRGDIHYITLVLGNCGDSLFSGIADTYPGNVAQAVWAEHYSILLSLGARDYFLSEYGALPLGAGESVSSNLEKMKCNITNGNEQRGVLHNYSMQLKFFLVLNNKS